jgi:RES domain-containing protein
MRRLFKAVKLEPVPVFDFTGLGRGEADLEESRSIGNSWAQSGFTVLSVPSVIIPEERNYVINVAHRNFSRIEFLPPKPFLFDPRLKPGPLGASARRSPSR